MTGKNFVSRILGLLRGGRDSGPAKEVYTNVRELEAALGESPGTFYHSGGAFMAEVTRGTAGVIVALQSGTAEYRGGHADMPAQSGFYALEQGEGEEATLGERVNVDYESAQSIGGQSGGVHIRAHSTTSTSAKADLGTQLKNYRQIGEVGEDMVLSDEPLDLSLDEAASVGGRPIASSLRSPASSTVYVAGYQLKGNFSVRTSGD